MDEILLNSETYHPKESDLPCLVTYGEGSGGSHFTISLVAHLFFSSSKILFITAFPMAKDDFLKQVGLDNPEVSLVNSLEELGVNKNKKVLILDSGNGNLFIEVAKALEDLKDRVVLVKNMEVFKSEVIDICIGLDKIILSGDIDACLNKDQILNKKFETTVIFTKPATSLSIELPSLEKWSGYLSSDNNSGIVKVQMK
ncbi:MAG: hypothetical protein WCK91_02975 [bacterium]